MIPIYSINIIEEYAVVTMLAAYDGRTVLSEGLISPVFIEISNLPPGGLGCDIDIILSVTNSSFQGKKYFLIVFQNIYIYRY